MISSQLTTQTKLSAAQLSDHDLWNHYRAQGLSPADATLHVERRRTGITNASQGNMADYQAVAPGKVATALTNFGEGASVGLASKAGDVWTIKNLLGTLRRGYTPTAPGEGSNTAYVQMAKASHPITALVSDAAGMAATAGLASAPLKTGPVLRGTVAGGVTGGLRGAIDPWPGFSRAETATIMTGTGAVSGAILGKFAKLPWVRRVFSWLSERLAKKAVDTDVQALAEAAIRNRLSGLNVPGQHIEELIAYLKRAGPLKPIPPPTVRAGETITPAGPRIPGTEGDLTPVPGGRGIQGPTGQSPPAKPGPTESFWEQLRGPPIARSSPDVGMGKVLPYFPRGGQVEQAFGPAPMTSPPVAGAVSPEGQVAAIAQYLRSLTPAQMPDALAGAQALGIPLGVTPEQVLALLLGGR